MARNVPVSIKIHRQCVTFQPMVLQFVWVKQKWKIYDSLLQALLFLHPLRLHHSLVFSHGLLCSLSRLASLATTGRLARRLIKIRHCVPGIELIQFTGLYSIFLRAQHTWTKVITQANNLTVHVYTENTENIWEKFTIAQLSELASWYACWPTYEEINIRLIFL